MRFFSLEDVFLSVFYAIIILMMAKSKMKREISNNSAYQYYLKGLLASIGGAYAISLIYIFYYGGGDTIDYMQCIVSLNNVLVKDFSSGMNLLLGNLKNAWYYFDFDTGYPATHMYRDPKSYAVARFVSPLAILAFNNYLSTSVLLATITYKGIWKFYLLLVKLYPIIQKQIAWSVLFVPSVVFWGSGIMKDTISFSATCWYVAAFYGLFMEKNRMLWNALSIVFAVFLLISIKPYILYSLLPGSLLWLSFKQIKAIRNKVLQWMIAPIILVFTIFGASFVLESMSDSMGKFAMENAVQQAQIIQDDLKRDFYGQNSFDLGEFDGSAIGMMKKSPIAINAALFRPYLIEARNPVMLISAIENTIILFLTLSLILKVGVIKVLSYIKNDPYLIFSVLFTLIFAFMVGFSTSNFGAMVRYKIPMVPFFLSFLFICRMNYRKESEGMKN